MPQKVDSQLTPLYKSVIANLKLAPLTQSLFSTSADDWLGFHRPGVLHADRVEPHGNRSSRSADLCRSILHGPLRAVP